ncbi:MAG: radical SAM protein, partial [Candidatus Woesearchaeota archaeon]
MQYAFNTCFPGPKSVKIHINSECNYNCVYCYSDRSSTVLSTSDWIDFINSMKSFGIHTVEISGGEPFLHKDLLKIMQRCYDLGQNITVYTNASLITSEDMVKLRNFRDRLIISVKYGCSGVYENLTRNTAKITKIEDTMKALAEEGVATVSFITVTKNIIPRLKDAINRSIELGAFPVVERYVPVKSIALNKCLMIDSRDWALALSYIKQVYSHFATIIDGVSRIQGGVCSCYTSQFSVLQDGSVVPCQFLPVSQSIGNIKKVSVNQLVGIFNEKQKSWKQLPQDCTGCSVRTTCGGGCRTYSFYTDNASGRDPLCSGDCPSTLGHCAFTVIHYLQSKGSVNNKGLRKIP